MSIITSQVLMEVIQEGKIIQDKDRLEQECQIDSKDLTKQIGSFIMNKKALLGSGSFSKVYRGHDILNQKMQVAIKVIQKSKLNQDLQRLVESEMKILRLINHPNIVKCYEILEDETSIYIVMELCEDGDLESRIDKYGAVVEADALPIVKGVFKGLLYLTEMNIIHRDIKVANIFMSKNIPKIADFGFAFHNKTKKQFQDISIGSPIYMSPQGIKHNVYGPKTDVWAFGIFIYEILHGRTPYSHCTKQKELKYNISSPINWTSFKASFSYSIKDLMLKCLEVNYQKRISFEKLKTHDLFQDLFPDVKLSHKIPGKTSANLSYINIANTKRKHQQQVPPMPPKFSSIEAPLAKQGFKEYCQKLQDQLSINLSTKNLENNFFTKKQQKLKGQFDQRNLLGKNFLHLCTPYDKNNNKSKSRETPRTREQIVSLEKKRYQNIASSDQYSIPMKNTIKTKSPNSFYRLKSQPIINDLLQQYKQYYVNDKKQKQKKRIQNQINYQVNEVLPTFGALNGHKVTKSNHNGDHQLQFYSDNHQGYKTNRKQTFKYGHKHTESIRHRVNSPNLGTNSPKKQQLRLNFSHKTLAENFFRKPKQQEDFLILRSNNIKSTDRVNCERTNRSLYDLDYFFKAKNIKVRNGVNQINYSLVKLIFPDDNTDCYMYLINFSRLLYKLSCNLEMKPYLWEIRDFISSLCLDILDQIIQTIRFYKESLGNRRSSQNHSVSVSLVQIQQTAVKYISQYKSQFERSEIDQNFNIKLVNSKLQNQLNSMIQKQIRFRKPQCQQSLKLMYIGWVYLVHFREVLNKHFMNDQAHKYWLDYNCKNAVKQIERDIEASNTLTNVETYLKMKKMLQDRQF